MVIRKARLEDAEAIASHLLMAMQDIVFEFIGQKDVDAANKFMLHFVQQTENQYSYQNCWVVEEQEEIIASANIYNGADLERLRTPIANYVQTFLERPFAPEDETTAGELYIDTLAVDTKNRGQGIGAKLLQYIIDHYVVQNHNILGLLVGKDNPNAKRLYLRLGFKLVGEKTLTGKSLWHLQIKP